MRLKIFKLFCHLLVYQCHCSWKMYCWIYCVLGFNRLNIITIISSVRFTIILPPVPSFKLEKRIKKFAWKFTEKYTFLKLVAIFLNPFIPNVPFFYSLKTSENLTLFMEYRKGAFGTNGLIYFKWSYFNIDFISEFSHKTGTLAPVRYSGFGIQDSI